MSSRILKIVPADKLIIGDMIRTGVPGRYETVTAVYANLRNGLTVVVTNEGEHVVNPAKAGAFRTLRSTS